MEMRHSMIPAQEPLSNNWIQRWLLHEFGNALEQDALQMPLDIMWRIHGELVLREVRQTWIWLAVLMAVSTREKVTAGTEINQLSQQFAARLSMVDLVSSSEQLNYQDMTGSAFVDWDWYYNPVDEMLKGQDIGPSMADKQRAERFFGFYEILVMVHFYIERALNGLGDSQYMVASEKTYDQTRRSVRLTPYFALISDAHEMLAQRTEFWNPKPEIFPAMLEDLHEQPDLTAWLKSL